MMPGRPWRTSMCATPKTGLPNADQAIYREIAEEVKRRCDVILCFTTGGKLGEPVENEFWSLQT